MSSAQDYTKQLQIVQNFFTKCVQIVADARLAPEELRPNASPLIPTSTTSGTNKWFNLELPELDFLQDALRPWKTIAAGELPPPLVIECYLDPSKLRPGQTVVLGNHRCNTNSEIVLERWIIECKPPSGELVATEDLPVLYKRAIVSIRSLYTAARLLPTWQLHQRLSKQKLISVPLKLGIKIHNGALPISSKGRIGLSKSIDRKKSTLQQFKIHPLVTPIGTLHCGVTYRDDVRYGVEDIEKIMAQEFMELDSPSTLRSGSGLNMPAAHARASADTTTATVGSHGSATSGLGGSLSSSLGPKPILNFTRPFRSPGTEDSAASLPQSVVGTPNSVQIAPQSIAGSVSSVVSTSSRFSSSFASQRTPGLAPRSYSNDGGPRGASVNSQGTQGSHGSHGSNTNLSHLGSSPGSDMYMAQTDIGDFMKYVDETSRKGSSRIKPSTAYSSTAVSDIDSSLSRFQKMRSSHIQLSDSIFHSLPISSSSPQQGSILSQHHLRPSPQRQSPRMRSSSLREEYHIDRQSSSHQIDQMHDNSEHSPNQPRQRHGQEEHDEPHEERERQEHERAHEHEHEHENELAHEHDHDHDHDQHHLQHQQQETIKPTRKRSSGRRSRLGFYTEQDDDDDDNDSDMLFALSDVHI